MFILRRVHIEQVKQKWESDHTEDLNVHVYLLPEIPHGFFHRWRLMLGFFLDRIMKYMTLKNILDLFTLFAC